MKNAIPVCARICSDAKRLRAISNAFECWRCCMESSSFDQTAYGLVIGRGACVLFPHAVRTAHVASSIESAVGARRKSPFASVLPVESRLITGNNPIGRHLSLLHITALKRRALPRQSRQNDFAIRLTPYDPLRHSNDRCCGCSLLRAAILDGPLSKATMKNGHKENSLF